MLINSSVSAIKKADLYPTERPRRRPANGCGPLLFHPRPRNSHDRDYPAGVAGYQRHCGNPSTEGTAAHVVKSLMSYLGMGKQREERVERVTSNVWEGDDSTIST